MSKSEQTGGGGGSGNDAPHGKEAFGQAPLGQT